MPPSITSGGTTAFPSAVIFAPICVSGSITRFIGRLRERGITDQPAAERLPREDAASSRIVVPELPQSMSPARRA